jgi:U5 small nuclear ribonucleoprotein component
VLEPVYKLYAQIVGDVDGTMTPTLESVGVSLHNEEKVLNIRPLLRVALGRFFGPHTGFVDMCVQHIPSPVANAGNMVAELYTGDQGSELARCMGECDPDGPLMIAVTKLYPSLDGKEFFTFGRIMSGTVEKGQTVRVLGEQYTLDDDEDMKVETVSACYITEARYKLEVSRLSAGMWVLLEGVDASIMKTATICSNDDAVRDACIFRPFQFDNQAICKISVEPISPSELPKVRAV